MTAKTANDPARGDQILLNVLREQREEQANASALSRAECASLKAHIVVLERKIAELEGGQDAES